MSQVIMLLIQYFEFQVKLLGPLQQELKLSSSHRCGKDCRVENMS